MKFYIASRFGLKEEVRVLYKTLEDKGHEIIADWTQHKTVKPYAENKELSRDYAIEDIKGTMNCDVFILISDEAGTGIYTELGAAIANNIKFGAPKIYVVGEHIDRSIFYYHPSVKQMSTTEEVFKDLGI